MSDSSLSIRHKVYTNVAVVANEKSSSRGVLEESFNKKGCYRNGFGG